MPCGRTAADALDEVRRTGVLKWGADSISGAPYVFLEDPDRTDSIVGFEVDIAAALAKDLGVQPQLVRDQWDMLIPFKDLELGRLSAVLMDYPIALYYGKPSSAKRAPQG